MKKPVAIVLACLLASCSPGKPSSPPTIPATSIETPIRLSISSTAFTEGQPIPAAYSCKGRNISPPLAWEKAPQATKAFQLIVEDPDAPFGRFVHWVVYNIPASSGGLPEAVRPGAALPDGTLQGNNGAGQQGYMGPCPPSGTHRYFFRLYALDSQVNLPQGASRDQLAMAINGHILGQGELMGTFTK